MSNTKKATFSLSTRVLEALEEAMSVGAAASKNALVERALIRELKEVRDQIEKARWEEAMRDPLFLQDLREVEEDFRYADAETAGSLD